MQKKNILKTVLPHIIAIVAFLIISYIYFLPASQGKVLHGTDNITAKSQQGEIIPYVSLTGDDCAWTNSAFGGMPAYTIWIKGEAPLYIITQFINFFTGDGPIAYLFIAMISFYLLLICYGVNPWLSIVGSVAYAFSSYFIIIIGAGHVTKVIGLAYMPGVIAGIYLAYKERKVIIGAIVMALFLAMEIASGHYQIVYYNILIVVAIGIHYLIMALKTKTLIDFLKITAILFVAALLAGLTNISSIWTTREYTRFSARGNTILSANTASGQAAKADGLDFEYATQWSYGLGESFNLLIPNFRGGSTVGELSEKSEVYKLYSQSNRAQANQVIKQLPLYWGPQPSTEGPAYMGALAVFLFVFAMFFLQNKEKWWILSISLFALILAWGYHFDIFNRFIFNYFPLYNKFRAVTTILIIIQYTIPFFGILALNELFKDYNKKKFLFAIKWAFAIVGGIALIFALFPGLAGSFTGPIDANYANNPEFVNALMIDRKSMLRIDAIRSFFFIIAGAGVLWLYHTKKLKKLLLGTSMLILMLLDLALVDTRYVSYKDFKTVRSTEASFAPTKADLSIYNIETLSPVVKSGVESFLATYKDAPILKNNESPPLLALNLTTNYRVLNLSGGINFSDALTSYYHKSLSGYSPAKLRRYQDLIDSRVLEQQIVNFGRNVQSGQNRDSYSLLNMLNTKYIITNPDQSAFLNRDAMGNAWFVKNIKWVENANDEFAAMTSVNPREDAAVNIEFKGMELGNLGFDPMASIKLENYKPHILTYKSSSNANMLAVFSEIYYPKGWHVYIDDKPVDYLRANYLFRSLVIPAGNHTIVFKFEPRSYILGNAINKYSSYLLLLSVFSLLAYGIWKFISASKVTSVKEDAII
ncbi:MAG: YfhO family protein [Bacteroidetes bacterium]|nr:YfhO family protein [Bacteroidota bacterium]